MNDNNMSFVSLIWGSFIGVDGQLILHSVCQSV